MNIAARLGLTPPNLRLVVGAIVSLLWLGFLFWYVTTQVGFGNLVQFQPNEIGAFLGGAFAPPAAMWFAIGFFHQWGRIADAATAMDTQAAAIERLSVDVAKQGVAIANHDVQVNRDTFMRLAEVYLGELNALAAEMIARFDPTMGEAAWNRYSMGDKQAMFRDAIERIREYKDAFVGAEDGGARRSDVVNRYLWIAEQLIHGAYRCDEDTGRYFEFSPIGTLYAALCHLMRREGRFRHRAPLASIDDISW